MSFLLLPTLSPSGAGTGSHCPIQQIPQADLLLLRGLEAGSLVVPSWDLVPSEISHFT